MRYGSEVRGCMREWECCIVYQGYEVAWSLRVLGLRFLEMGCDAACCCEGRVSRDQRMHRRCGWKVYARLSPGISKKCTEDGTHGYPSVLLGMHRNRFAWLSWGIPGSAYWRVCTVITRNFEGCIVQADRSWPALPRRNDII